MPRPTEPPADLDDSAGTPDAVGEESLPASEPASDPASDPADAAREPGFFVWLRRLDLPRRPGWLGGVCAGVAVRLGLDPLLVRGVAVVIAVIGGPAALLYAFAWFLLPDENGTIHAQELGRGRVTRALPGIVAVFLLSFLPIAQGFWFAGSFYWSDFGWPGIVLRVLWTAALVAAVIVVVVWLARRSAESDITTKPATTDDKPETVPTFPADAAAATVDTTAVPDPGEPPAPPADASAEELAAWKRSQDEWQQQRALWVAEQRRTDQERQRAEARARAIAALDAARERARVRMLTRPRARAGIVFLVLGVALVAAALSAYAAQSAPATRGAEWMIGAAVLTLVLGVGILAVGLARRRSGFLSFLGMLSVAALLVAAVVPAGWQVLPLGADWGIDTRVGGGSYAQLAGQTRVYVVDRDLDSGETPVVDLWQFSGGLLVDIAEGATLRLELTTDSSALVFNLEENLPVGGRYSTYVVTDGELRLTVGSGEPDLVLRVWVGRSAWLNVASSAETDVPLQLDPEPDERYQWDDDGEPVDPPAPTPSPTPTEGVVP